MSNKLILGTVQFGLKYGVNNTHGKIGDKEINEILKYAHQKKIEKIDTSTAYGDAEKKIGNFIVKNPNNIFKITTKISYNQPSLEKQLLKSLENLKVEKIDCLFFHSLSLYNYFLQDIPLLIKKYKGIKFNEIGISLYTNDEISTIVNDDLIDRIQLPFNLLDNASQRENLLLDLKLKGKKIDARSVFLQGLFFKPIDLLPIYFNPIKKQLTVIKELAKDQNISIENMAINYALQKDYIDRVLIGVDTLEQLKSNLSIIDKPISIETVKTIDHIFIKNSELLNPSKWPK